MNDRQHEARMVFDKTAKGREEIASRRYRLASRLRTLLVLADGKQDREGLLKMVAGIGLDAVALEQLLNDGFIECRIVEPPPAPSGPTAAATAAPAGEAISAPDESWTNDVVPFGM